MGDKRELRHMQTQTLPALQLSDQHATAMQILLLDDSETDRMRILRLCKDAGLNFIATEVETVEEFQQAIAAKQYDLVFVDYLLAGEDGLQAIDVLNGATDQRAASIMIAGEGQIAIAVEAMRRGCSDYLTKPELTVAGMQKSVATAIERRMISFSLQEERAMRVSLEQAIRQHTQSCSAEMRTILSSSLRRIRMLREQRLNPDSAQQLGALEETIDKLWDVMPSFSKAAEEAVHRSEHSIESRAMAQLRPN